MKKVVLIGAGAQGRETADILLSQPEAEREWELLGFVDDNPEGRGACPNGAPLLGDFQWLAQNRGLGLSVICCTGDPKVNRSLARRARDLGLDFANAVSPQAVISPRAVIGRGVAVYPGAVISTQARVGDHCILNIGASVSHDSVMADYCILNPGARLAGNVSLGEGCYLGMGCNVIQGLSVGAWTVVGAGAAVIADLPAGVTAVGAPARVIAPAGEAPHD